MPRARTPAGYPTNVFINCPFDAEFEPLFHAIVFAVIQCGYTVRCALETDDTGATRIDRIYRLIEECRFGIHDISRIEHDAINNLPRFNMPFELGLFLGARRFGGARPQRDKQCLVLEAERYRYQKYLSDIAGQGGRRDPRLAGDLATKVGEAAAWGDRDHAALQRVPVQPPAMLRAADLEPAELGFFDRANLMAEFLERRVALAG
jgi:hypothetical protein